MREITYKKLGEAMNVTVSGIKGKPSHSYDKWGSRGGVEAWKKHVASIHKGARFSDHDGKLAKNTHAHVGDKEVGSYSHYNHSSETLREAAALRAAAKSVRERHPSRWPTNESRDDSIKHMAAALFGAVKVNRNGKKVVDVDKQRYAPHDDWKGETVHESNEETVFEAKRMKTGNIPSAINGKKVTIMFGDHAGKTGVVKTTRRDHTFSAMVPYVTRHYVDFGDGKTHEFKKQHLRVVKEDAAAAEETEINEISGRLASRYRNAAHLDVYKRSRRVHEQIEESKDLRKHLQQNYVGADETDRGWYDHDKKDGTHTIRRGFYYKHGRSSEDHAKSVSDELTKLGVKHKIVDHGTVDKPFRGGASLKRQSHWWAKFTTESALDEVHSKNQLKQAIEYHSNRGGSTYVGGAGTDPRHLRRLDRKVKLHRRAADVARKMLAREDVEQIDEIGYTSPLRPYKKTDLKHSGFTVWNGKLAHSSSNPNMRMNRRVGVDRDVNVNMSDDEIKREMDYHDHKVNKYLRRIKGDKSEAARRMIGAKLGPGKLPENTQIDEAYLGGAKYKGKPNPNKAAVVDGHEKAFGAIGLKRVSTKHNRGAGSFDEPWHTHEYTGDRKSFRAMHHTLMKMGYKNYGHSEGRKVYHREKDHSVIYYHHDEGGMKATHHVWIPSKKKDRVHEGLSSHARKTYRIAPEYAVGRGPNGRSIDYPTGKHVAVKFTLGKAPWGTKYEIDTQAISDTLHGSVRKAKREVNRHMKAIQAHKKSLDDPMGSHHGRNESVVIDEVSRELLKRYKAKARADYVKNSTGPKAKNRLAGAEASSKRLAGWNPKTAKKQANPMFESLKGEYREDDGKEMTYVGQGAQRSPRRRLR